MQTTGSPLINYFCESPFYVLLEDCRGVSANLNCRNWNLERGLAISRGLATLEIKRLKTWLEI